MENNIAEINQQVLPAPNLYNRAILEAFQRSAANKQELYHKPDLVIILGGSFGKGLGHYFSDSDWMYLTQEVQLNADERQAATVSVGKEFNHLVETDSRYFPLKRYTLLGDEIEKRTDERERKRKEQGNRLSHAFWKEFRNKPVLLQKAFHSSLVHTQALRDKISYEGTFFYADEESEKNIKAKITSFDPNKQYGVEAFDDVLTLLTSEKGVNAFEVKMGNFTSFKKMSFAL